MAFTTEQTKSRKDPAAHVSLSSYSIVKQQKSNGRSQTAKPNSHPKPRNRFPPQGEKPNPKPQFKSRPIPLSTQPTGRIDNAPKKPTDPVPASQQGGVNSSKSRKTDGRATAQSDLAVGALI